MRLRTSSWLNAGRPRSTPSICPMAVVWSAMMEATLFTTREYGRDGIMTIAALAAGTGRG